MTYTKISGTILNAEALINVLATNLISYGWTQEYLGDNIISSVNLGKKLIMKKGSIYTYFAASDNNDPRGNNSSFSSISCLKFCCSLTLNTTNDWYFNNVKGSSANNSSGVQLSSGASYNLYINNDNFILSVSFSPGLYSTMIVGNVNRNSFFGIGSISGSNIKSGRLENYPIFSSLGDNQVIFKDDLYINKETKSNVLWTISDGQVSGAYFPYYSLTYTGMGGLINRGVSTLYNNSIIFGVKYYSLENGGINYSPVFDISDVGLVNFSAMSSTQSENEGVMNGIKKYDFIPFLKKEAPQIYSNNETFGCGLSIRIE